jgi:cytochrome c oxidase subunit 3
MNFFRQIMEKPWEAAPGDIDGTIPSGASTLSAPTLGLRMFMIVVSVLFLLLIIAYGSRMTLADWRPGPEPSLLWFNTVLLVLSSFVMQFGLVAMQRGWSEIVRTALYTGGIFAIGFVVGQSLVWRQLAQADYFSIASPAVAFFYMITALHVLHLGGGLIAWGRTLIRMWGGIDEEHLFQSMKLCTVYFHFMLAVWLVLFGLLFADNEALGYILTICGLN